MKRAVLPLWISMSISAALLYGCRPDEARTARLLPTVQTLHGLQQLEVERMGVAMGRLWHTVATLGNDASDTLLTVQARSLHDATLQALARVDQLEAQLVREAGGLDPQTKSLLRPGDYAPLRRWQNAHFKRSPLIEMLRRLTRQAGSLRHPTAENPAGPMHPAGEIVRLLSDGEIPVVTGLALLASLRIEMARHSTEAIRSAHQTFWEHSHPATGLIGIVRQSPERVREGDTCTVEVQATEYATFTGEAQPAMYANGERVPVQNGVGKVRFIAGRPAGKRTWEGKVMMPTPSGRDSTFEVRETYYVLPE